MIGVGGGELYTVKPVNPWQVIFTQAVLMRTFDKARGRPNLLLGNGGQLISPPPSGRVRNHIS
jgi:hypothetical protein